MANFDAYKLDDARAAGFDDDQIAETLHKRYGDIYNVRGAREAGHSVDEMLPVIEKRRQAKNSSNQSLIPPPTSLPQIPQGAPGSAPQSQGAPSNLEARVEKFGGIGPPAAPPTRLEQAGRTALEFTLVPSAVRLAKDVAAGQSSAMGEEGAASGPGDAFNLMAMGAGGMAAKAAGISAAKTVGLMGGGAIGAGAGEGAAGPEAKAAAERIRGEGPGLGRKIAAGVTEALPSLAGSILLNPGAIRGAWNALMRRGAAPAPVEAPRLADPMVIDEVPTAPQGAPVPPPAPPQSPQVAQRLRDLIEAENAASGLPGAVERPIGELSPAQEAITAIGGEVPRKPVLPVTAEIKAAASGFEKKPRPQTINDLLEQASIEEPAFTQPPGKPQSQHELPAQAPKKGRDPIELVEQIPDTPTPAASIKTPPASISRAVPEDSLVDATISQGQVAPVDPRAIAVDPERFQFKLETNAAGIQKELPGEWDPLKAGNLILWQDEAGKTWVVNGHHRLDKAVKTNAPFVNSMVLKAKDGWSDRDAMILGAELNIAEGRGTIYDAAKFFRLSKQGGRTYDAAELRRKGLSDAPGERIGTRASDDLYAAFAHERINKDQTDAIVRVSSDPSEQAVGLAEALSNPKADAADIANLMAAQRAHKIEMAGGEQAEMFGHNDAALNQAREMAKAASAMQRDLSKDISAAQGAVRNPEAAAKSGVNISDQAAAEARLNTLKTLRSRLDPARWYNDPEVVDMVRAKAFKLPEKEAPVPMAAPDDQTINMFGQDQAGSTNLLDAIATTVESANAKIHTRRPANFSDSMGVIPENLKQVYAQLGITGEVSRLSPVLRWFARPEDVAPAIQRDASRVNDLMYQSMTTYGDTISKVSKTIGRRLLKPEEVKPEWLAWKRQHQGLPDESKVFMTSSDLVAMGLDARVPMAELPADIQAAVRVARKVLDAVAGLEGFKGTALYRPDYFPHIFDNPAILRRLKKEGTIEITPYGPISSDPFLKERLGLPGWSLDWDKAVRARVWQAHKKVYLEPLAFRIDAYRADLPQTTTGNAANAYLEHYRNDLMGRPSGQEQALDDILGWVGEKIDQATGGRYLPALERLDASNTIRKLQETGVIRRVPSEYLMPGPGWSANISSQVADSIFTHLIGGAMSTAIKNLLQGVNTFARTSTPGFLVGYRKAMPQVFTKRGRAFLKNDVLRDLEGIWDGYNAHVGNKFFDTWKKLLRSPMQFAELVNRGAAYHAGAFEGAKLASKGLLPNTKEAIHEYALGIVDQTQFKYGVTNTNPYFQNPVGKILRILTSFPQAQTMFLTRLAQNKQGEKIAGVPAGLVRLFILTGVAAGGALKMGLDISETVGAKNIEMGKPEGFGANRTGATTIPVPLLGTPQQYAQIVSEKGPPGVKAAQGIQALLAGDVKKATRNLAEVGQMVILGKMGIPKEAMKLADLLNEYQTGSALKGRKPFLTHGIDQQRAKAYNVTHGEATQKYFGLRPKVQRAYLQAMEEKAAKRK